MEMNATRERSRVQTDLDVAVTVMGSDDCEAIISWAVDFQTICLEITLKFFSIDFLDLCLSIGS